jgi:hypothetical protein
MLPNQERLRLRADAGAVDSLGREVRQGYASLSLMVSYESGAGVPDRGVRVAEARAGRTRRLQLWANDRRLRRHQQGRRDGFKASWSAELNRDVMKALRERRLVACARAPSSCCSRPAPRTPRSPPSSSVAGENHALDLEHTKNTCHNIARGLIRFMPSPRYARAASSSMPYGTLLRLVEAPDR